MRRTFESASDARVNMFARRCLCLRKDAACDDNRDESESRRVCSRVQPEVEKPLSKACQSKIRTIRSLDRFCFHRVAQRASLPGVMIGLVPCKVSAHVGSDMGIWFMKVN